MTRPAGVLDVRYETEMAVVRTRAQGAALAAFLVALALLPFWVERSALTAISLMAIWVVAAHGLNLLTGYAGQISIGHAAFVGVGERRGEDVDAEGHLGPAQDRGRTRHRRQRLVRGASARRTRPRGHRAARDRAGHGGRRVLEHLTVEENLEVAGYIARHRRPLRAGLERVYAYFPRLRELRHRVSGYISGGEQQMLVIGRAVMAAPRLVLLDEPSLGLAPALVDEIFRIVRRINEEDGASFLLVEQNAVAALEIASHGYVMESGRVVLDGPAAQLRENEDVKEFYLGFGALAERKSYRDVKHYRRRKRWLG